MNKKPLVSIIMNCFNSEKYLKEAIDSVFDQTFSDWEIVFWDNISTDGSAAITSSYDNRLRYFLAPKHTELGVARNLALKQAKGKYVGFLDCDDIFLEDKLKCQIGFMEKNDHIMSYGSAIIIDENGRELRRRITKNNSGKVFGGLLRHYEISMLTVVIRRSLLIDEKLNFDTNLKYNPDFNLFMRIASKYPIGVMRDPVGKYRIVDNSLSSQTISIASEETKYTLNQIYTSSENIRVRYEVDFTKAYAKLHYYDAVAALYKKDRGQALKDLRPIIWSKIEYFILYVLILVSIPTRTILKVLGR
jgi:glycosyltransferase involved in cell wall biosynthesis